VGHYSKDCPKPKPGNGGFKVIGPTGNIAQSECNHLILLKGKVSKREVLCLLDTRASHNFITRKNVERMELQLEEFKAPIEVHFADGVPHPIML
jgi:predicted aspartyl protease